MFLVSIGMKVIPGKREELSQTLASLIPAIRAEEGCRRCECCRSASDENEICLLAEWDTQKNAAAHLKSELFKVLLGATSLLQKPHEVRLYKMARRLDGIT